MTNASEISKNNANEIIQCILLSRSIKKKIKNIIKKNANLSYTYSKNANKLIQYISKEFEKNEFFDNEMVLTFILNNQEDWEV